MLLAIIFAVLIGLAHYVSHKYCLICSKVKVQLISLIAGVSTVYVLLGLYPEFYKFATLENKLVLTSVLVGFAVFYLIDKEIYQKVQHKGVRNDVKIAHGIGLVFYYLVVGLVLVKLINDNVKAGILFFIPVFIYAGLSTLSAHGIHGMHGPHHKTLSHLNLMQTVSVIIGALIGMFFVIKSTISVYAIGLVAGILTYIILRDILPKDKKGQPLYFVIGALGYTLLIVILWMI